ncbi:MAG: FGGY family carbohydrate kinase [Maribacter sp.]|nr:FGGY family carbohydrate kinase [Maribacter sp.]
MSIKVSAVFDIGKTNKKFFLFDTHYHEVYREYTSFDEIADEDGFPTENLEALVHWIKAVFQRILLSQQYEIETLNFSCYGASLVHIDENGKTLTPLYNYMKPLKDGILNTFYDTYGPEEEFLRTTGSLKLGMLNSGMQLYWLKYKRPEIYKRVKYSLHLPQYLSYVFTGIPVNEYSSIGCHTIFWDFEKNDYHEWVYKEHIDPILPPIVPTDTTYPIDFYGKTIRVGVGIHDSSSALLPYIRCVKKPFVLVSTGTWSIAINPFARGLLTDEDIRNGCIFNMQIDGRPVKVSRLFLGNEYVHQVTVLATHYNVPLEFHKQVVFDADIFMEVRKDAQPFFKWKYLEGGNMPSATNLPYGDYKHAYHRLLRELVELQVRSIRSAIGEQTIDELYIDGGFTDNEVYITLLTFYLGEVTIYTTHSALGSALGAVIVLKNNTLPPDFLKSNYALKKQLPVKIK